ncbi:MAG: NACHT domain-containing protein, partial [Thiotrichaceae bacterium]|nr:NACHT domain-containing protein [Thiotrichaceae bacterium]
MSILNLILLFTTVAALGFAAYFWYKAQSYTRERFAFAILSFISSVAVLLITIALTQQSPFNIFFSISNQFLGTSFELVTVPLASLGIVAAILSVFCLTLVLIHKNWRGQISQHHHEALQSREPINLFKDSYLVLTKDESLEQYNPEQDDFDVVSSEPEKAQIVWKEHARELLSLRYPRKYQFEQWHEDGKYWRGKLQDEEKILIVACWQDLPANNEIKGFLQTITDDAEVIIVVREGDFDKPRKLDNRRFRQISESKLLDSLIDISDYFRQIEQEVTQPLKFTNLSLQDMYTISYFYKWNGNHCYGGGNIEAYIEQWLNESSLRQLSVLGHYGMGKTSLSNMLTYKLLQRYQQGEQVRIPILIRLRGKTLRTLSKEQVLDLFAGQYKVSRDALLKLLVAGRLLLIFEGFDELDLIGDKDMRRQHFKPLWDLSNYAQAKTLITGRPNFFFDDDELKAALRTYGLSFQCMYSEPVYLHSFNFEQMQVCLQPIQMPTR